MRNHLRPPNTSKNQLKSWYRKLRKIISDTIKYDFENSKNKMFILDG